MAHASEQGTDKLLEGRAKDLEGDFWCEMIDNGFYNNVGGGGYGGEGGSGGRNRPQLAKPEPPVLERFRGGKNVQLAGQIRDRNHRLQEEYQRNLARYYEQGGQ